MKILGLFVSGFVFLSFVLGTLINQPDIPLSINGILTKLSGESAFVLMSLLGATLVPHNFYLHSSIVQVIFRVVFNFSNISIIACFIASKLISFVFFWICLHLVVCLLFHHFPYLFLHRFIQIFVCRIFLFCFIFLQLFYPNQSVTFI